MKLKLLFLLLLLPISGLATSPVLPPQAADGLSRLEPLLRPAGVTAVDATVASGDVHLTLHTKMGPVELQLRSVARGGNLGRSRHFAIEGALGDRKLAETLAVALDRAFANDPWLTLMTGPAPPTVAADSLPGTWRPPWPGRGRAVASCVFAVALALAGLGVLARPKK